MKRIFGSPVARAPRMKTIECEDVVLRLGQTAGENAALVRDADPTHYWVHLERFPSGHVIVEAAMPSDRVLARAASLCLDHTKYRRLGNVYASATPVSNLKPADLLGEVEFLAPRRVRRVSPLNSA